jgi:hypothetical protein
MKPAYETERRSGNRWFALLTWAFGIFGALMLCRIVVAQIVVQAPAPTAPVPTPEVPPKPALQAVPSRPVLIDDTDVRAARGAGVQKWEYKSVVTRLSTHAEQLNAAGAEGWEAFGTYGEKGLIVLFKRPLRAAPAAFSPDGPESTDPNQLRGRTAPKPTAPDRTTPVPPSPPESDKRLLPPYRDPAE